MSNLKRNKTYKNLVIGIYADSFRGKTGVTDPYMSFLKLFGIPFMITSEMNFEQVNKICDALIVPGGADVNSLRYNEPPHPQNTRANMHYEWMDDAILKPFMATGKPILGICRGFQTINVLFGGTLYQNMRFHHQGDNRTRTNEVLLVDDNVFPPYEIGINTMHHQAVKKLGDNLIPIGYSPVYQGCETLLETGYLTAVNYPSQIDSIKNTKNVSQREIEKRLADYQGTWSIVEAFQHETLPILGVQYHPEEFNCPFVIEKFDNLLETVYGEVEEKVMS